MRAFEIYLNCKRLCVVGIGNDGVLSAIVTQVIGKDRNELRLDVGGLSSSTQEDMRWRSLNLHLGDEVRVRIVESEWVDRPRKRSRKNPNQDARDLKHYVRRMAKKFGWEIKARG